MVQFILSGVLSGVAALVVVAIGGVTVLDRIGRTEAIRNAHEVTRILGRGVMARYFTRELIAGDKDALARLDSLVRRQVLQDPVVRVKVWTPQGRILYSDEPRLIGELHPIDHDKQQALATGRVYAEVSELSGAENRFERQYGKLLEVYLPVTARNGQPLLLETYQRYSSVAAGGHRTWTAFAPPLLAALILLELIQVPLAHSLSARLRERQREREALLKRAIEASEIERRRIASDLHDGVVQELAGLSYKLAAASTKASVAGDHELGATLGEAAADTRHSMRELRSLLVEIHPPNVRSMGLHAALSGLLAPLSSQGMATRLEMAADGLPREAEVLTFRVAQESLRNVVAHADASKVSVSVTTSRGRLTLLVEDDGRGFSAADRERRTAEGHMGLRLLADLAAEQGGRIEVRSTPGRGTRLRLEAPLN
jgi:two-component system NarL family sensor kinase